MSNNDNNSFNNAKRIFTDRHTKNIFISLDSSIRMLYRLSDHIQNQPFPIILIHGKPGVGKTFLLQEIYNRFKKEHPILFYKLPFHSTDEFITHVCENFLETPPEGSVSLDKRLNFLLENLKHEYITVIIDEVQMYDKTVLEYVRLLSDTKRFRFVLAMHQVDDEDIIAKEYFSSRIWDTIEMKNLTNKEMELYIQKRLSHYNMQDLADKFNKTSYNQLHRVTKGNFRHINKLLYKMFDIYEYFYENQPSKLNLRQIERKYLEMAAIDLGLIRA